MATAFQPNAFQPTAFQQHGGVTGPDVIINIGGTQDGDVGTLSLDIQLRSGAAGRRQRYVVYINGRRYIGYQEEIYALLESMAEADAEVAITGKKPPKRRIVVQPGRETQKFDTPRIVVPDLKPMQEDFRRVYLAKLAHEMLELERDDEEVLLLI